MVVLLYQFDPESHIEQAVRPDPLSQAILDPDVSEWYASAVLALCVSPCIREEGWNSIEAFQVTVNKCLLFLPLACTLSFLNRRLLTCTNGK